MTHISRVGFRTFLKKGTIAVVLASLVVGAIPIAPASASSQIPKILNYQARITDASGVPVADGNLNIWIKVYDAPSGGTCLYSMKGSCGTPSFKTVTVSSGVFSMLIGETGAGDTEIPDSLFDNNVLFLGVTVASDTEMVPRKRIAAAPYALNSDKLDDLDVTDSGSTTPYVVSTTSNGNLVVTGDPQGSAVSGGSVYVNPANAAANETLFGIASAGSSRWSIDKEGDVTHTGSLLATAASSTSQFIYRGAVSQSQNIFEVQDSLTNRILTVSATATSVTNLIVSGTCTGCGGSQTLNQAYLNSTSTTELFITPSLGALTIADTFSGTGNIFEIQDRTNAAGDFSRRYFTVSSTNTTIGSASNTFTITPNARFLGNLTPQTDVTYDLGDYNRRWKTLHVGPGSVIVHNDTTQTSELRLQYSGSTAQLLALGSGVPLAVSSLNSTLQLTTASNPGIQVSTAGKVGIGAAPDSTVQLYVKMPVSTTGCGGNDLLKTDDSNGNTGLMVCGNRAVGINTGSPTDQLTVRGTIGGVGGMRITRPATTAAPTVTTQGTPGSTTWRYKVTVVTGMGETLASAQGTTTTGNATLDVTNFNRLTITAVAGFSTYRIYRTTAGGTPSSTGLIATTTITNYNSTFQVDDTGAAATTAEPTVDTSADVGFGTSTPSARLTIVDGAVSPLANILEVQNSTNTNRYFSISSTSTQVLDGSSFFVGSTNQFQVDSSGNLVKVNNVVYSWPSSQGGASTVLQNNGSGTLSWVAAGSGATLQTAYDSSTGTTEIFLGSARGALTLADSFSSFGGNLFEIQDRTNGTGDYSRRYFTVSSTNTTIGGLTQSASTSYVITPNAQFAGNLTPSTDNLYSLGDYNKRWKDLWLSGGSANIAYDTSGTSVMKVGIETTTGLRGVIATPDNMGLQLKTTRGSNDANGLYISTAGNVGVGTVIPDSKLNVVGGDIGIDNNREFKGKDTGGTYNGFLHMNSSNEWVLQQSVPNGTERFTINGGSSKFIFSQQGGADLVTILNDGRVGIGNTAPANEFTVGSTTSTFEVNTAGNLVKVNNVVYSWPASQGGASTVLQNNGSGTLSWVAAGSGATLQTAYDSSTGTTEIFLGSARGALTISDSFSSFGGNLFEIQDRTNGTGDYSRRYLTVSSSSTNVFGTNAGTGDVLDTMTIGRLSDGTAAAGLGAGLVFRLENGAGSDVFASRVNTVWTDAATGTEDSRIDMSIIEAGAARKVLSITENYAFLGTGTANRTLQGGAALNGTFGHALLAIEGNGARDATLSLESSAVAGGPNIFMETTNGTAGSRAWKLSQNTSNQLILANISESAGTNNVEAMQFDRTGNAVFQTSTAGLTSNLLEVRDRGASVYSTKYLTVSSTSTLMGFGPTAAVSGYTVGIGTGAPTARLHVVPDANQNALSVTGLSLTGAAQNNLLTMSGTWNTSAAPIGILLNITDTASSANSELLTMAVSGATRFAVKKSGTTTITLNNNFAVTGTSALTLSNTDLSPNNFSAMYFGDGLGAGSIIANQFLSHGASNVSNVIFQTRDNAGTLATRLTVGATSTDIVGNLSITGTCTGCGGNQTLNQAYLNSTSTTELFVTPSLGALTIADTFSGTGNIFEIQDRTNAAGDYSRRYFTVSATSTNITCNGCDGNNPAVTVTSGGTAVMRLAATGSNPSTFQLHRLASGNNWNLTVDSVTSEALQFRFNTTERLRYTTNGLMTQTIGTIGTIQDIVLDSNWTNGTVFNADFGASTIQNGAIVGSSFNFNTNLTSLAGSNITGYDVQTPILSTGAGVSTTYTGYNISSAGALTNSGTGTFLNWRGLNMVMPVTQTVGNSFVSATGVNITGIASSSGNRTGVGIEMGQNTGGTETGIWLQNPITGGGNETGIIFSGTWDRDIDFRSIAPSIAIADTQTLTFFQGANTLMTLADAGTTGTLTITGNLVSGSASTTNTVDFSGARIASNLTPTTDNAFDLGDYNRRWRELWLAGGSANIAYDQSGTTIFQLGWEDTNGRRAKIMTSGQPLQLTPEVGVPGFYMDKHGRIAIGTTAVRTPGNAIGSGFLMIDSSSTTQRSLAIIKPVGSTVNNFEFIDGSSVDVFIDNDGRFGAHNRFTAKALPGDANDIISVGSGQRSLQIMGRNSSSSAMTIIPTAGNGTTENLLQFYNESAENVWTRFDRVGRLIFGATNTDPTAVVTVATSTLANSNNIFEIRDLTPIGGYTQMFMTVSGTGTTVSNLTVTGTCTGCSGTSTNLNQAYLNSTSTTEIFTTGSQGALTVADTFSGTGNIFEIQDRTNSEGDYSRRYLTVSSTATSLTTNFLITGTDGAFPTVSGAGTRLMYIPSSDGAFRAGKVTGTEWNSGNVGLSSVAIGGSNIASGQYSAAFGDSNTASGGASTVIGQSNTASNGFDFAGGSGTAVSGSNSFGFGQNVTVTAPDGVGFGNNVTVSSQNTVGMGLDLTVSAANSQVFGKGQSSSAVLLNNVANSFMVGYNSTAPTLTVRGKTTSGTSTLITITGQAHTGLTASTEVPDVNFALNRTVQWATGALTTQRAAVFQAPTYSFVGASTITNAATLAVTGAPVAGTNATITNAYSFWSQDGRSLFDYSPATNNAVTIAANALTTGVALSIASTGTGLTSGSLLNISTATTGALATNGVVSLNATGNYTSTSNVGLLSLAANSTTAGTVMNLQANALTSGIGLRVASTTSGALSNGLVRIESTGGFTSSASETGMLTIYSQTSTAGTLLGMNGDNTTTGTLIHLAAHDLTTGNAITAYNFPGAGTGMSTGRLLDFDGRFRHTVTNEIGTLAKMVMRDISTVTSTSIGLYINPEFSSVTAVGTRTLTGIKVEPTFATSTNCNSSATHLCVYNGIDLVTPSRNVTVANTTLTFNGLNLTSAGTMSPSASGAYQLWNGIKMAMPSASPSGGGVMSATAISITGPQTVGLTGAHYSILDVATSTFSVEAGTNQAFNLNMAFTSTSANNVGLYGFRIKPQFNLFSTSAGTKSFAGFSVDNPTYTQCVTGSGKRCGFYGAIVGELGTSVTHTSVDTLLYHGLDINQEANTFIQSGLAGTIEWRGVQIRMPNTTQTTGTVTSVGLEIFQGNVTSGSQNAIVLNANGDTNNFTVSGTGTVVLNLPLSTGNWAVCHMESNGAATKQTLVDCASAPAADYMEMYPAAAGLQMGDIVMPGSVIVSASNGSMVPQVVKTATAYEGAMLGVMSNPADIGDFNAIGFNIPEVHNPQPVALKGRVKVKVNMENGAIKIGDPITSSTTAGVGMKSKKPGMIVGSALEAWNGPGQGTILVFMGNGWHSGLAVTTDGVKSLFGDDFAFKPTATSSASGSSFNSFGLSFRGSTWNGASNTSITRNISVLNETADISTYQLAFRNDDNNLLASLNQAGDLSIAGSLSVDGGFDYAESFPAVPDLDAGDIVMVDPDNATGYGVKKSDKAYENTLLGVISTKPGFLTGKKEEDTQPVALAGRVPVKVSVEGGEIKAGDPITSSSERGVGMKAIEAGRVVGIALQGWNGAGVGVITLFVNPSWWNGPTPAAGANAGGSLSIQQDSLLDFKNSVLTNVAAIISTSGSWGITSDGQLVAAKVEAKDVVAETFTVKAAAETPERTVGVGRIQAGYDAVLIPNAKVKPDSLIVVTFEGNPGANWWIDEKVDGHFVLKLAQGAHMDLKFTYWIVPIEGALDPQADASASSTPETPPDTQAVPLVPGTGVPGTGSGTPETDSDSGTPETP